MPSPSGYPREMHHPCGYKTIVVYDADEERAFHADAKVWRDEQMAAHQAALKGESIKPKTDKGAKT